MIIAALTVSGAGKATADICVSCTGPAATYDCAVKKAEQIESFAGAKALKKICVKVLKRNGQHSNCSVIEGATCPGALTTIGWKEVKDALASPDEPDVASPTKSTTAKPSPKETVTAKEPAKITPPAARPDEVAGPPAPPAPTPEDEPTVTGSIKGAAEKTWNCLSSLFGKC